MAPNMRKHYSGLFHFLCEIVQTERLLSVQIFALEMLLHQNKKILKNILTIEHMFNYNIDNK